MPGTDRTSTAPTGDRFAACVLAVALFSAVVLVIPALQGQPLALDEHVSFFSSGARSLAELWERSLTVMATPPASHLLERLSLALFGVSETSLRLPSLVAFVAAVGSAWFLGKRAGGAPAGALTALILTWHPDVLDEVRIARCYGLELFLATVGATLTLRWLMARRERWIAPAWAIIHGLLLWTHYLAAPLIVTSLGVVVFDGMFRRRQETSRRLLEAAFVALFLMTISLPLASPVWRLADWSSALNYRRAAVAWGDLIEPLWRAGAPAALVAACVLRVMRRRQALAPEPPDPLAWNRTAVLAALWLVPALTIAIAALATENATLTNVRYRIMLAPISAAVLASLLVRLAGPRPALSLTGLALIIAWAPLARAPLRPGRLGDPSDLAWKQEALALADDLARPDTLGLTQTGLAESVLVPLELQQERFLKYVACRLGAFYTRNETALPLPLLWQPGDSTWDAYRDRVRAANLRQVIIVGATDTDLNRGSLELAKRLVREAGYSETRGETNAVLEVVRYTRIAAP